MRGGTHKCLTLLGSWKSLPYPHKQPRDIISLINLSSCISRLIGLPAPLHLEAIQSQAWPGTTLLQLEAVHSQLILICSCANGVLELKSLILWRRQQSHPLWAVRVQHKQLTLSSCLRGAGHSPPAPGSLLLWWTLFSVSFLDVSSQMTHSILEAGHPADTCVTLYLLQIYQKYFALQHSLEWCCPWSCAVLMFWLPPGHQHQLGRSVMGVWCWSSYFWCLVLGKTGMDWSQPICRESWNF